MVKIISMKNVLLFVIAILLSINLSGQNKYSTTSKKAIKAYEEALQYFNRLEYEGAVKYMNKAIKADNNFIEAHLVLAEIFIESGNRDKAKESYLNTIKINPDFFPGLYFSLAQLEMQDSRFEDGLKYLEKYLSYKNIQPNGRLEALRRVEWCKFAIDAIKNPVPFNPINLGDSVNTEYDEYWPSLTADEKILVITRLVPKTQDQLNQLSDSEKRIPISVQSKVQEDFFISIKENEIWQKAVNAGEPLNTNGNEGAQTIRVDGNVMYFTACNRPDGKGRCDIYLTRKKLGNWSEIENLGEPVNTSSWEAQPSISADGKTLYFVSTRAGGIGGKDIWFSMLKSDNKWSQPVNLGNKINSKGDEQSPFIHPDNKTLYFSSEGRIGMGGYDIYKVSKNEDGTWSDPENLGYPINSIYDEVGLIVNARGNKAMFSSDRLSDKGRDIFQFELYEEARPQPVSYFKGTVFNSKNKKKLKATFELINIETNEIVMQAESDENSGEFLVCIPSNNDYALNVSKPGYLFYSDNFSLKGVREISDPYLKDIALNPIQIGQKIILKNIFYETDSYELSKRSMVELSKLIEFLQNNSSLKIEISGHTDNVGTHEYNLDLSENRAKSVYLYLIESGINKERLQFKGYGENQPVASNETESGKSENRRTEIKIISAN